jgi:DNA-binding GntR family transcriptional regulator
MTGSPPRAKARTRVEQMWTTVRGEIRRGALRPGDRSSPSGLAQRYGVSHSVLREAFTRLAGQGLVVAQSQLGFTVTSIRPLSVRRGQAVPRHAPVRLREPLPGRDPRTLRDSAELYLRWSAPIGGDNARDVAGAHRAIFEPARAGDVVAVLAGLKEHIAHTTSALLTQTD